MQPWFVISWLNHHWCEFSHLHWQIMPRETGCSIIFAPCCWSSKRMVKKGPGCENALHANASASVVDKCCRHPEWGFLLGGTHFCPTITMGLALEPAKKRVINISLMKLYGGFFPLLVTPHAYKVWVVVTSSKNWAFFSPEGCIVFWRSERSLSGLTCMKKGPRLE